MVANPPLIVLSDESDSNEEEIKIIGETCKGKSTKKGSIQLTQNKKILSKKKPRFVLKPRHTTAETNSTSTDIIDLTSSPSEGIKFKSKNSHLSETNERGNYQGKSSDKDAVNCGICYEKMSSKMACGPCGHVFCEKCLRQAVRIQKKCPTCRRTLQLRQIHKVFINL